MTFSLVLFADSWLAHSPHKHWRKPTFGKAWAPSGELLNCESNLGSTCRLRMRRITYPCADEETKEGGRTRSDKVMPECKRDGGSTVFARGLVEDMGKMMGNGFLAQPQLLSHLAIGETSCQQAQHLHLTSS